MLNPRWAVILAGGKGSRFWPLSTAERPKQLMSLCTERPMLMETVLRVGGSLVPMDQVLVVTGPELANQVNELVGPLGARVLVEPMPKSTGPCLAWAARWIAQRDPDAVMSVLPADHLIANIAVFRDAASLAMDVARDASRIVTMGIEPDRPATGFGYIQRSSQFSPGVYNVSRFVEKPDRATAENYVESGTFSWNAGMFFMRVDVFLEAVCRHRPGWQAPLEATVIDGEFDAVASFFELVDSVSVDVAIMEAEGSSLLVIPVECGWSDLGSWSALVEQTNHGTNYVQGDVRLHDVEGSVVVTEGPRVTVLGLENVCVAVTNDEVLVIDLERDQDVRFLSRDEVTEN